MRRYLGLLAIQLRASVLVLMQYRLDFVVGGLMGLFWAAISIVPLAVLYQQRKVVAGWSWYEALVVLGCFQILRGLIDGAIQPALRKVVDHIRQGTLDFLIIKPVDAQFMVSTSGFTPARGSDAVGGVILIGWALHQLGHRPSLIGILLAVALLAGAAAILYSTWTLVVSLAFFAMRADELSYVFSTIYDFARWPASIFRGVLSFVFTFVLPLAVMTTSPALALLDRLSIPRAALALGGAAVFTVMARATWLRALARYTGAGG
jgi:ABC-2 type transport system permease protein